MSISNRSHQTCRTAYPCARKQAMLYQRWQEVAAQHRRELALIDLNTSEQWTFAQLADQAGQSSVEGPVYYPSGTGSGSALIGVQADGGKILPWVGILSIYGQFGRNRVGTVFCNWFTSRPSNGPTMCPGYTLATPMSTASSRHDSSRDPVFRSVGNGLGLLRYPPAADNCLVRNVAISSAWILTTAFCIQRIRSRQGVVLRSSDRWLTLRNNASMLEAIRRSNITTKAPFGSLRIQGRSSSSKTVSQVP